MRNKIFTGAAAIGLLASLLGASPSEQHLAETLERWEHLRVGPGSTSVANLRLTSGNLTVILTSGIAAVVKAGERPVGMFVSGTGSLEYRSVDPIEFPRLLSNLRSATSLKGDKGEKAVTVRDSFTDLLWLRPSSPLPEVAGSPARGLDADLQRQLEKLKRVRAAPMSHRFAMCELNAVSAPVVFAAFSGGKADLTYMSDEAVERSERLTFLRKSSSSDPELKNELFPTVLSDQPIGRDRRDPQVPPFLLTDVRVDLEASAGDQAAMTVLETVVPQGRRQSLLRFELENVKYAWVGSGVLARRSIRVREVADGAGRPLRFHHSRGDLLVELAEPAEPDRPLKLRFQIEGDFLIRPGGDNFWVLGLGGDPWFPQPDLGGQYYTWHAKVRVKKPFVPFSSGTTVARSAEADANIVETEIDKPISSAVVMAGKYEMQEETKNGVKIRVATYALRNERAMKQLATLAASVIEYDEAFLGPFPFPEFQIVEVNEFGYGVAPPGMMFITKEAFNPTREESRYFSEGVNERFAHEIAHQYWGHVVKMPSLEEQWLEESFAEYCAALFLKQFKGKAVYENLKAHWKSGGRHAREIAPIPLANGVYEPQIGEIVRYELLYEKGPYLLAALHQELGDDTFFTFLKSYQKSFRWKFGSTKTVQGLLQFMTKKDYGPFFEANYWGTGMPN